MHLLFAYGINRFSHNVAQLLIQKLLCIVFINACKNQNLIAPLINIQTFLLTLLSSSSPAYIQSEGCSYWSITKLKLVLSVSPASESQLLSDYDEILDKSKTSSTTGMKNALFSLCI